MLKKFLSTCGFSQYLLLAILAMSIFCLTSMASATTTYEFNSDPTLADNQATGVWYTDRYPPDVFKSDPLDGDSRLHQGINATDQQTGSFYNTQGRKYDINLEGSTQSIAIDLYVDSSWETGKREVGIWATGYDNDGNISAYPIVEYRHYGANEREGYPDAASAGFYTFDYINGGWIDDPPVTDFDKWYNLKMVLNVGTGMEYYINGQQFATFADSDTKTLDNVILNAYNFGEDYDIYWDNLETNSVPEPTTWILFGTGLLGLLGFGRKKLFKKA